MTHHRASGLEAGLTEQQIDDLGQYETSENFDEIDRVILHYTEQLVENVSVSNEVFEEVQEHFTEREIVELTLSICTASFTNHFNEALDVPLEML